MDTHNKVTIKKIDWDVPASLRIEKALCPICGKETGRSSDCYNIESDSHTINQDPISSKTIELNGTMLPIFSRQCYFRENNEFIAYSNYPISFPLITELSSISGIEQIIIKSTYKFRFTIGDQFDEHSVINSLKDGFFSIIKQAKEKINESKD